MWTAVSRVMGLLCACGGVMDSKEVVVVVVLGGGGGEYCSLAAAACIHGKQIWFLSDFSHWRSQSFSLSSSNSPPFLPRRQKDKIKSDVPICPPSFFFIYLTWPLPYKHGLNMPYKLPRLDLIEAGIFVVLSDDSRFH